MPLKNSKARREYHRNYMRERLEDPEHKKVHLARVRRNSKRYAIEVAALLAAFRSGGCRLCPENEVCCLTAHHVDPKTKAFELGNTGNGRFTPNQVRAELLKCVCLCMNCHTKVHAKALELPCTAVEVAAADSQRASN